MAITEWSAGKRALTGTQSHWFYPVFSGSSTGLVAFVPYTAQYGSGTPPWTVTLAAIGIDANGNPSAPIPLATYATGFDFQVETAAEPGNLTAVVYTVANGTYPASHAVDVQARLVDSSGKPVSGTATLLTGVVNLEQFHLGSIATNGNPTLLAYSTYDSATQQEQVRIAGYNIDGTAVPADSRLLDSFTSYGGYSGFGFGTLTPAGSASPSFVYLRSILTGSTVNLAYGLIGTNGAPNGPLHTLPLSYDPGSTHQTLGNWTWSRLDAPTGGNNLVTAAVISDTSSTGGVNTTLDVRVLNTAGGPAADDVIAMDNPDENVAITRTANGGFVVGYVYGGFTSLRQYDNQGDVIGEKVIYPPDNPGPMTLDTLPDGRLLVAFPTANGTVVDEDIFTLGTGPVSYRVDAGVTRTIALASGDSLTVKAGGIVSGLTSADGAQGVNVLSGGQIRNSVLNGNSEQIFGGGSATQTTLNGLAAQSVVTGASASATVINANALQSVGGQSSGTIINAQGTQYIGQPGHDYGARINAGGLQEVDGIASNTIIAGGDQEVWSGGVAQNAVVTAGIQDVFSGGTAVATTVNGGLLAIESGASVSRTVVNSGGALWVSPGAVASGATVNAGGVLHMYGSTVLTTASDGAAVALNGGHLISSGVGTIDTVKAAIAASGTGSTIEATEGTLDLAGPVSGPVALQADAGSTLILEHGAGAGAAFSFAGASTLRLGDVASFSGSIAHLGTGDAIDLQPVGYSSGHLPTLAYAAGSGGGTLTVAGGGQTAKLALLGSYSQSSFHLSSDGHGGTLVNYG